MTQILATFDSRKIAHVLFENLKHDVFLHVLEHAFFCKCYYTAFARNNFKYLTEFACLCMIFDDFKRILQANASFDNFLQIHAFLNFEV